MKKKYNSNYPVHPVHNGDATADSRTLLKQPREIIKVAHCIAQIPLHSLFSCVPFPSSVVLFLFHSLPYRSAYRYVGPVARYHIIITTITLFPHNLTFHNLIQIYYIYLYIKIKNKSQYYEFILLYIWRCINSLLRPSSR